MAVAAEMRMVVSNKVPPCEIGNIELGAKKKKWQWLRAHEQLSQSS